MAMSEPTEPDDYVDPKTLDRGAFTDEIPDSVRFCPWCGNETFHHGYDIGMDAGHGYCYCTFCESGVFLEG